MGIYNKVWPDSEISVRAFNVYMDNTRLSLPLFHMLFALHCTWDRCRCPSWVKTPAPNSWLLLLALALSYGLGVCAKDSL